jgi:hypothetical protein
MSILVRSCVLALALGFLSAPAHACKELVRACPTAEPAIDHVAPGSSLPSRLKRERAFCEAGVSALLRDRGADEMDRDLLFLDAARFDAAKLRSRHDWLSPAQAAALVRAVAKPRA